MEQLTKNITAFAVNKINGQIAVTYSYDEIDLEGRVVNHNVRDRRFLMQGITKNVSALDAVTVIEDHIVNLINK